MTTDNRPLADIANGQHGAITASQITDAGISTSGLRRRVQSGVLERVGVHTLRSPFVATSALADLTALVLDCGDDAFVSGPTAAALHGFDGFKVKPPFHVTIIRGRNVQRVHHHVHTTTELPLIDRATVADLATMSATRTLVDVARFVSPRSLTAALDSALRDGLTSEELLHRRIVALRSRGRYGIPRLIAVIEGVEVTYLACSNITRGRRALEAGRPILSTRRASPIWARSVPNGDLGAICRSIRDDSTPDRPMTRFPPSSRRPHPIASAGATAVPFWSSCQPRRRPS